MTEQIAIRMPEPRRQLLMKILTDYVGTDRVPDSEMQEFANILRDVGVAAPPRPLGATENIGSCEPDPVIIRWGKTGDVMHTDVDKVGRYSVKRPGKRMPYQAYLNNKDLGLMPSSDPAILRRSIERRIREATRIATTDYLTPNQLALMAAILGVSNAGSDHLFEGKSPQVTPDTMRRSMRPGKVYDVDSVTTSIVSGLCESDEMLDMFLDETRSWVDKLKVMPIQQIKETWPRYAAFIDCTQ